MRETLGNSFEPEKSAEAEKITREKVIAAYKKFVDQGIVNPDDLDLNDKEVQKANDLFEQWQKQEEKPVESNEKDTELIKYCKKLDATMFYVDAGFTDPDYLDEVLEWLNNDLDELGEEQEEDSKKTEIRRLITEAIKKVEALIG